jgi:hypothetical protein
MTHVATTDEPHVVPMVEPRGQLDPRWLFAFEKWYFDGQTADGSFFFLYLAPMVLAGKRSAELVISLFPADGGAFRRSFHVAGSDLEVAPDRCSARVPAGHIRLSHDEVRVKLDLEGAAADLTYRPMDGPWSPHDDGVIVRRANRVLRWVVPLPRARLDGTIRVDEREVRFEGFGYSDFVQTDIPPWSLPLRELLWGRVLGEDALVVFNRVGVAEGNDIRRISLGLANLDGGEPVVLDDLGSEVLTWADHGPTDDRYPVDQVLTGQAGGRALPPLLLHDTRLNLGEYVADVQRFGSGLERWLYRAFTGDPVEYKLLSRVRAGDDDLDALAAHEWIRWGRGRS